MSGHSPPTVCASVARVAPQNADKDDKLKAYGYPTYYAEYEFRSEKLVRFRFGFEYP